MSPTTRRCALAMAVTTPAIVSGLGRRLAAAQDATPAAAAVAPPQDLLPKDADLGKGTTAKINGVDIYYEVYGEGDPVFLLHGGLGNGDYFVNQIPALAEHYKVVVMDSRGHGRSSFDATPISYAVMAGDVLGLMDLLKIEKADIVGWSDGGIIGLDLAIKHPDRLNRVVAYGANYDPSGVRLDVDQNAYFNAYIEAAAADYQKIAPQPQRWDEFLANISHMWATEPNYTEDQLRQITTPFLFLDGMKEEAIDLNQTKLMACLVPGSSLDLMPDTGHFAMFEQPAEFNKIVLDYLAG